MTFAERLRRLRDEQGLSEAKLADQSGVPFATIHNYGLGRRIPTFPNVVKIAKALGVDCTAFADCDDIADDPEPAPPAKKPAAPKPRKPKGKA